MKSLTEAAKEILQDYVNKEHGGVRSRAARALNLSHMTLKQWLDGTRSPNLEALSPVFAQLGVSFSRSVGEAGREVCFVNARIVPAGEGLARPEAEDYIAAPLVGEVGAGPGYIPQEEIRSWFLAYKHLPAIRYRRNLIAVEIGKHSYSMRPTLSPGDIVLVDRDDRNVEKPGFMMLVMDPDGAGMIKRVSVESVEKDFRLTLYSDNAINYPPVMYSLKKDYFDDWDRAIVGRVIWAWSDVREK